MPLREVNPAGTVLWRVGRYPDPLAWTPWPFVGGGRFGDPRGVFRVLYLAEQRLACFLETLARFRVDLPLLAELAELGPGEVGDDVPRLGSIAGDWLATCGRWKPAKRCAVSRPGSSRTAATVTSIWGSCSGRTACSPSTSRAGRTIRAIGAWCTPAGLGQLSRAGRCTVARLPRPATRSSPWAPRQSRRMTRTCGRPCGSSAWRSRRWSARRPYALPGAGTASRRCHALGRRIAGNAPKRANKEPWLSALTSVGWSGCPYDILGTGALGLMQPPRVGGSDQRVRSRLPAGAR